MNFDSFWQLLRYGLMIAGGIAVGKGWVTEEQVVTIVGAIGALATVGWGMYVKAGTTAVPTSVVVESKVDPAIPTIPTVSTVTGAIEETGAVE